MPRKTTFSAHFNRLDLTLSKKIYESSVSIPHNRNILTFDMLAEESTKVRIATFYVGHIVSVETWMSFLACAFQACSESDEQSLQRPFGYKAVAWSAGIPCIPWPQAPLYVSRHLLACDSPYDIAQRCTPRCILRLARVNLRSNPRNQASAQPLRVI